MFLVLAQAMPTDTSFLGWIVSSLATISSIVIVVTAALIFLGAYYLVSKKRPVASLASYLVVLPIPFLVSISAGIYGSIASLATIASTPNLVITNQGIAGGLATILLSILFAIVVSIPAYLVLAYGLIARDFRTPNQGAAIVVHSVDKSPVPSSVGVNAHPMVP